MNTIKEIAKLAGVAPATVSRVLNNRPDVRKETKEAVLAVIERLKYTPNANAKNLKMISNNLICVIVKGIGNLFLVGIIEMVQARVEASGYMPYVQYIDEAGDEIAAARQLLIERKPLAFVVLGGSVAGRERDLEAVSVPCVFATTDAGCMALPHVSSVCIDDRKAARMAIDRLLSLGHRSIAVMGGSLRPGDLIHNRYLGVRDAFSARGVSFQDQNYIECKFSLDSAYQAMQSTLTCGIRFTALFAMSDIMAIGAARAVADAGLAIPGDISVVGFDGIDMARYYIPSLATVRQPAAEIARASVEIAVRRIRGESGAEHVRFDSEFVAGQSLSNQYTSEQSDDIASQKGVFKHAQDSKPDAGTVDGPRHLRNRPGRNRYPEGLGFTGRPEDAAGNDRRVQGRKSGKDV